MKKHLVWNIYYRALKLFIKRRILKRGTIHRTQSYSGDEYDKKWRRGLKASYIMKHKMRPQILNGRLVLLRPIDHRKFFLEYVSRTIKSLNPKQVLDLGSGNGMNILALAIMNPGVEQWQGAELSYGGVEVSKKLLSEPPIQKLMYLTGETEQVIRSRLAKHNIEFIQGDITNLPWKENSFDFGYSMWVLEQIPREYVKVFKEAKRVIQGHVLFLEAFAEAQNIFQNMHLKSMDYFHGSYKDVGHAGLKIFRFEPMAMHKIKFRNGALLCYSSK